MARRARGLIDSANSDICVSSLRLEPRACPERSEWRATDSVASGFDDALSVLAVLVQNSRPDWRPNLLRVAYPYAPICRRSIVARRRGLPRCDLLWNRAPPR